MIETKSDSEFVICAPREVCASAIVSEFDDLTSDAKARDFLREVDADVEAYARRWREAHFLHCRADACRTKRCVVRRADLRVKIEVPKYVAALVADVLEGQLVMTLGGGVGGEECARRTADRLNRGEIVRAGWEPALHAPHLDNWWCVAETKDLVLDHKVGPVSVKVAVAREPRRLMLGEFRELVDRANLIVLEQLVAVAVNEDGHRRYHAALSAAIKCALDTAGIAWSSVKIKVECHDQLKCDWRARVYVNIGFSTKMRVVFMDRKRARERVVVSSPAPAQEYHKLVDVQVAERECAKATACPDALKHSIEQRTLVENLRQQMSLADHLAPGLTFLKPTEEQSAAWSAALRAKVVASAAADAARDRAQVSVRGDWVDDEEAL